MGTQFLNFRCYVACSLWDVWCAKNTVHTVKKLPSEQCRSIFLTPTGEERYWDSFGVYFGPILRHFRVKLGVLFGNLRFCWAYIGPLRAYVRPYNILGQLEGYMLALSWLPLWQGSQLAVDTTLVSPLTSAAEPWRRGGRFAGTALHAARQTKERTYPELVGSGRCRLVVLAMEVGGRWSAEAAQFLRLLAQTNAQSTPGTCDKQLSQPSFPGGRPFWPMLACKPSHRRCSPSQQIAPPMVKGPCPPLANFSPSRSLTPPCPVDFPGGDIDFWTFRGLCISGDGPV